MTFSSKLVLASSVFAAMVTAGCGGSSTASAGKRGADAGKAGHVRAAEAVVARRPSLEVERLDTRNRVVQSLIAAADLAGRNDWRGFDRAITDARRGIQRYRKSAGGDVAALSDAEELASTVDHVIALASYTGRTPDFDDEFGADADTIDAVVHLGVGVNVDAVTGAVADAIGADAKTSLPVENPQP